MKPSPNSPYTGRWGYTAKIFVASVVVLIIMSSIFSAFKIGNTLFTLFAAVISLTLVSISLLQIPFIHDWFINQFIPLLNTIESYVIDGIKQLAMTMRKWQKNILVGLSWLIPWLIVIGFVIKDYTPIPTLFQHNNTPTNGIYVTSMQVNKDYMNIGIIGDQNQNASPFNLFDDHNGDAERSVRKLIFDENARYGAQPYVVLIVATTLSQTMSDPGISSRAGLDSLSGSYMYQYNYNHDPANGGKPKLKLLIANFGTKDAALTTVPQVMDQIKRYADSDPLHFIGLVGLPFSKLVTDVLDYRYKISSTDIPVVTSAAEANYFTDDSANNVPTHFYDNFYSIAPSVSDDSQVINDFVQNHLLLSSQTKTAVFVDSQDRYSSDLSVSVISALGQGYKEKYTVGQPHTLDGAIADVIKHKYNQIFFAGYADDFNILRNKLKANPVTQNIPIIGGEGLYYPYPAVYDNSGNSYNYTKLFFTTDAAYAQTNSNFSDYIPNFSCSAPGPLRTLAPFNNEFCHWFYHANPPGIYGYALPGFHTLLMYDAVNLFLKSWDQRDVTSSPYWKVIDTQLPITPFEGISGHIQYTSSTSFHPVSRHKQFKPVYIACIDSNGYTHIVAEYHVVHQTNSDLGVLYNDSFNQGEENQCTNGNGP